MCIRDSPNRAHISVSHTTVILKVHEHELREADGVQPLRRAGAHARALRVQRVCRVCGTQLAHGVLRGVRYWASVCCATKTLLRSTGLAHAATTQLRGARY
eukprot:1017306-Rhodomonas_salina.1